MNYGTIHLKKQSDIPRRLHQRGDYNHAKRKNFKRGMFVKLFGTKSWGFVDQLT
jgi:hypothetical protein